MTLTAYGTSLVRKLDGSIRDFELATSKPDALRMLAGYKNEKYDLCLAIVTIVDE